MVRTTPDERAKIRDRFIWLYNNCQNRAAIPANCSPDSDSKMQVYEDFSDTETRQLCEQDVKITNKYSTNPKNNAVAHLRPIESAPYFRLGIRFKRWRDMVPENKLITLGHELGHARYPNHKTAYWHFTISIWNEILNRKEQVESALYPDASTNWNRYKANAFMDTYESNNRGPNVTRENLVERLEHRFNYNSEWINMFLGFGRNVQLSDSEWDVSDKNITRVSTDNILFTAQYSDEYLYSLYTNIDMNKYEKYRTIQPETPLIGERTPNGKVRITEGESYAYLMYRIDANSYATHHTTIPVVIR